jgi:flagellar protein FliO/FliZ
VSETVLAFLRLAVALPLVLLLCVVVLKYLVPRTLAGFAHARRMRVVEQLPLGPKTGMSLVQVGECYYLLVCHEGAVTVVKEMDQLPAVLKNEPPAEMKPLRPEAVVGRLLLRRTGGGPAGFPGGTRKAGGR